MKLYPSFREAVRSGKVDLKGPLHVCLTTSPYDRDHKARSDLTLVEKPRSLKGEWEDDGESERLTAPPTVWEEVDVTASGCVLCAGEVLIGHCVFPKPRTVAGGDFYLEWPDGVLTVADPLAD